jgi:protein-disulfide isomerase
MRLLLPVLLITTATISLPVWAMAQAPQASAKATPAVSPTAAAPAASATSVLFTAPTVINPLDVQPTDLVIGQASAPITLIEYASLTCSHCRDFHLKTLPEIKTNWLDTGKAKYVLRDMPWDNLALGMAKLARCVPPAQQTAMYQALFTAQPTILANSNPLTALVPVAQQAGLSAAQTEACIRNNALQTQIEATKKAGYDQLNVRGTPTLFVNGTKVDGFVRYADLKPKLDAAYAKATAKTPTRP